MNLFFWKKRNRTTLSQIINELRIVLEYHQHMHDHFLLNRIQSFYNDDGLPKTLNFKIGDSQVTVPSLMLLEHEVPDIESFKITLQGTTTNIEIDDLKNSYSTENTYPFTVRFTKKAKNQLQVDIAYSRQSANQQAHI